MPEPATLRGRHVLITRPQGRGVALASLLRARGAEVTELPMLAIEPAGDPDEHRRVLQTARNAYGWIFTSTNAVTVAADLDSGPWPTLFAIGPATAAALARLDRAPVQTATQGHTSEDLLRHPHFAQVGGKDVLLCSGAGGRTHLQEALRARGAQVQKLELYCRRAIRYPAPQIEAALAHVDTIVCTSAEGLHSLFEQTPADARAAMLLPRLLVVPSVRVLELAQRLGFAEVCVPRLLDDATWADCLARTQQGSPRNPFESQP